jgi:outer membrane lipoprotein-sorting protein
MRLAMNRMMNLFANRPTLRYRALSLALGLLVVGSAALSLCPPAAVAAPAEPAPDLTHAIAALRGIATLRADFVQRSDAGGQQVTGVLSLKRGGKIRFQYQRGYPVLIISDGRALTIIDSEVNQIQRWPIGNSPLGALLDPAKDVSRYGSLLPGFGPNAVNVRVEDRSHPEYGVMTLTFVRKPSAPGGLELEGWQTQDAQNRRTAIRLTNHQYGGALSDELFRFIDPRARPHK